MKKLATILAMLFIGFSAKSQHTADIGVLVSAAAYWGDIEKVDYSRSVTPVIGALGRWNFNKRLAIRGQLTTGNLKADGYFSDAYMYSPDGSRNTTDLYRPQPVDSANFNFKRAFQSVEALFEFNFMNYKMGSLEKDNFTPFVALGVGGFYSRAPRVGTFILEPETASMGQLSYPYGYYTLSRTNKTDVITVVIPVGMGLKFNISKSLGGVVEVMVRKTFADNIDNLDDPTRFQNSQGLDYPPKKAGGILAHNDWYGTVTVSLLYQLWRSKGNCKIYDKIK